MIIRTIMMMVTINIESHTLNGPEDPDAAKVSASPPCPELWRRSERPGRLGLRVHGLGFVVGGFIQSIPLLLVVVMSVVVVLFVPFSGHHCSCSRGDDGWLVGRGGGGRACSIERTAGAAVVLMLVVRWGGGSEGVVAAAAAAAARAAEDPAGVVGLFGSHRNISDPGASKSPA